MVANATDRFVAFQNVKLIGATAQALFCQIGSRRVWLPRRHTSGKLYGAGDRGQLLIRHWLACERHLLDLLCRGTAPPIPPLTSARSLRRRLRLVRRGRRAHRAN
jgi:hypothetical protein